MDNKNVGDILVSKQVRLSGGQNEKMWWSLSGNTALDRL